MPAELGVLVVGPGRLRAVVDVETEVVAGPVDHPAAVVLAVLLVEGVLDGDALGQQPHSCRYSAITRIAVSWMSLNLTPGRTASMAACCAAYTAS